MAPRVITVRYTVDSVDYEIKETVKMKSRTIKIGPIPIGQHKRPVMPEISEGSTVRVNYSPASPAEAFLTDNIGIRTA